MVGLAVAVGGLTLSSITSSIGGGGGAGGGSAKAPEPVKQLLDRVPEPLPVGKKAQQAATQVTSKGESWLQRLNLTQIVSALMLTLGLA